MSTPQHQRTTRARRAAVMLAAATATGALAVAAGDLALAMSPLQPGPQASVGAPNRSTGVVTGSVGQGSASGTPLTYTAPATTAKGTVVVNTDGVFTYTPTATARHAAAKVGGLAPTTDTFTITITDGYGGSTQVPITVPIGPANAPPVLATRARKVTAVAPTTGVVTGRVSATDPDGDPLTYQANARSTAKGSVSINARNGAFTYTPTAAARRTVRSDSFTVTVSDGYGGSLRVPVRVPIR